MLATFDLRPILARIEFSIVRHGSPPTRSTGGRHDAAGKSSTITFCIIHSGSSAGWLRPGCDSDQSCHHHHAQLICPSDVADIYGESHDDRLPCNAFDIKGQEAVTDEQGEVTPDVMFGKIPITDDADVFYAYEGAADIYCTEQSTQAVRFAGVISNPSLTFRPILVLKSFETGTT